jgi:glutathione S-transferase
MPPLVLVIGNKNYSSWSMRAWLLLRWLDVDFEEKMVSLYRADSRAELLLYSPAAKVPVLMHGPLTIWDTFAIIAHLEETHPRIWPADLGQRAFARSICAEMHSGFSALRSCMPYNARGRDRVVPATPELRADVDRVQDIWSEALQRSGAEGPYLLGTFGIADIMFAPVATRFRTYGVEVRAHLISYWNEVLDHPLCREWFAAGAAEQESIPVCEVGFHPQ